MRKVCWDVQFATIILLCCFLMPSSAVIQALGYSAWEKDSLSKAYCSDKHFITQAEVFLQENVTLADISSAGEAALVNLYTGIVGDTLDKLRLLHFHQKVATSTRFVQPENLLPT